MMRSMPLAGNGSSLCFQVDGPFVDRSSTATDEEHEARRLPPHLLHPTQKPVSDHASHATAAQQLPGHCEQALERSVVALGKVAPRQLAEKASKRFKLGPLPAGHCPLQGCSMGRILPHRDCVLQMRAPALEYQAPPRTPVAEVRGRTRARNGRMQLLARQLGEHPLTVETGGHRRDRRERRHREIDTARRRGTQPRSVPFSRP
jgi:hypothetical protein